ncbi:MAG: terminase gpA endonuclease subunit [Rubripirellula sp.]
MPSERVHFSMHETSLSLLDHLRHSPENEGWNRLAELYTPLIRTWLQRYDVQDSDAHDLVQEVLLAVSKDLGTFEHRGQPGAFRGWLKAILINRLRKFWRARERCNHDELSAIQHAMNLKLQDDAAFFAEYQNEPLPAETVDADQLTPGQVAGKINNMPRLSIPIAGNHLTAFIDVQGKLLFYVVAAWEDDFTGYVVDYGTYPDQQRPHFTLRDARHTLANATDGTGLEGSIYAGLDSLTTDLLGREWQRDDGAAMKIGRCLIDANWGHSTNVVYQFCRQSPHASILLPSHGRFVGASSNPFSEYKRRPGDRVGLNWRIPSINGKRAIRHIIYDTNWWKSFTHARLAVAMGDHGCLSIFGDRPDQHRMFAEQITAEYFVKTEGRGRTVDEWKARPEQPDNHWLDCLVGCAVGASMQGALLFGTDAERAPKTKRISFKEMQQRRRG